MHLSLFVAPRNCEWRSIIINSLVEFWPAEIKVYLGSATAEEDATVNYDIVDYGNTLDLAIGR